MMRFVRLLAAILAALTLLPVSPTRAAEVPHIFVFTRTDGFRHGSIPHSIDVLRGLAQSSGAFTVEFSEDTAAFTPELFDRTDIILFANTTGEHPLTDDQKRQFEEWLLAGGGFMGIHAAADTNYQWPAYQELVGAAFESHPHTGNRMGGQLLDKATVQVEDREHAITEPFSAAATFQLREEYYKWRVNPRGTQDVHVLLSLDETSTFAGFDPRSGFGALTPQYEPDQPLEWTKSFRGANRVWYTNLGHYNETYDWADWQEHFVAAVRWVAEGP
jgi:type 1 glutamine amidotransferase